MVIKVLLVLLACITFSHAQIKVPGSGATGDGQCTNNQIPLDPAATNDNDRSFAVDTCQPLIDPASIVEAQGWSVEFPAKFCSKAIIPLKDAKTSRACLKNCVGNKFAGCRFVQYNLDTRSCIGYKANVEGIFRMNVSMSLLSVSRKLILSGIGIATASRIVDTDGQSVANNGVIFDKAKCSILCHIHPLCTTINVSEKDAGNSHDCWLMSSKDNEIIDCMTADSLTSVHILIMAIDIPPVNNCGIQAIQPNINDATVPVVNRIVGGTAAISHSWPWQVVVLMKTATSYGFHCGGSILNSNWIMTAAHCCSRISPIVSNYIVRVGVDNMRENEATSTTFQLSQLIVHPKFNTEGVMTYDLCLLKTAKPIPFSREVSPICLPDKTDGTVGKQCWATGWGLTGIPGDTSNYDRIRQVDLRIMSPTECLAKWTDPGSSYGSMYNQSTMICAANPQKNVCSGDSGGPLACQDAMGRFKLVGISSFISSRDCNDVNRPPVFARPSENLDWINSIIKT